MGGTISDSERAEDERSVERAKSAYNRFERLFSYDGSDKVIPWREYLKLKEKDKDSSVAMSTGYAELDSIVDGFRTQELITLSGNTGMGKTLFTKSLVRSFASQDIPITIFSFEDPPARYLSPFLQLPHCETIYVPQELKAGSYAWIEERVTEATLKNENKIVLIDHLHYVVDMNLASNFSLNIGATMRFLKQNIATKLNQIVIVVCHQEKINDDIEPGLSTIRDSSFIGQESDMVFVVNRTPDDLYRVVADSGVKTKREKLLKSEYTYNKGYSVLKIEKARRAGAYRERVDFQKKGLWLEPI